MDPIRLLQDLIDEFGLTYTAEQIGIQRQYLHQIVRRDRPPSQKVLGYLGLRRETRYIRIRG